MRPWSRLVRQDWFLPLLAACVGFVGVAAAIDVGGDFPGAREGPGLTLDEGFNVQQGVFMADRALAADIAGYRKVCDQLPDHPPLGRLWIGVAHELTFLVHPPVDPKVGYSISCARVSGAAAFAGLILAVGWFATRWHGRLAGFAAAISLVLMPRLFGHAHLASLETSLNLTYVLAVLYLADRWGGELPPDWRTACKAGLLFGLVLLTKVQAILLPIPVALWALCVWRKRAIVPLLVWGAAGTALFFAGWPWMWRDPLGNLLQYLGRTTDRSAIQVWYLGQRFLDREVPWHYPWVMFLVTVPVGLHLLGGCGLFAPGGSAWKSRRDLLLLACMGLPLLVFSVPGVAVYDGERLFLMVFPLWGVLIGRGADAALCWLRLRMRPVLAGVSLTGFIVLQSCGLFSTAPCYLSYYNLFVGGLRGADALGFEPTYWGDTITRDLLEQVVVKLPRGSAVQILPVMHQFQVSELQSQSPIVRDANIRLRPFSIVLADNAGPNPSDRPAPPQYVLLFMRKGYLAPELHQLGQSQILQESDPGVAPSIKVGRYEVRLIAAVRRDGVLLAALCEFR